MCVACVTWFIFVVDTYVAGVVELSVFHFSCTIILALQQMDVGKFENIIIFWCEFNLFLLVFLSPSFCPFSLVYTKFNFKQTQLNGKSI